MSHNQATGMMADELRSFPTTARQFLDSVYFPTHWKVIRLPFISRTSTLATLRR